MAQTKNTAPRFSEVVIVGKPKVVKAFLKGLLMGAESDAAVYYSFDEGVHHEGKTEKLKEMFGLRGVDCHVIVESSAAAYLKKQARRIAAETGLEITSNRSIRSASMAFTYHAFAPRYHDEIVALLKNLPAGLRLQGFQHDKKVDPAAKGVEAYAVAHDFEASGSGTVTGRVDLLIEFRRSLAKYPLIQAEEIRLKTS